ncbi:hypothetical protein FKQ51_17490 [Bacillus toyonensis]|uniref:hypothetical protein n=1 Tax=Bacillus toyonensis TaxID=155322 RepID=UPI0026FDFA65|nr:hypothetical protein [Bacillus toyonensis]MDO8159120.1 hypothetical protein [Bacillus toyonensis]
MTKNQTTDVKLQMLRDLEELVLSIKKQHIREYMKEALNCYNVGSYRACIILSTIAAMHDLREKIKDLSSSIKEIRDLDDEIESRISNEENYENYMIEQAAKVSILVTSEVESIKSYSNLRNRCAHPNEYVATEEEARMVFSGYLDNVISKPSLLGPSYINVIIKRLDNAKLFPNYTQDVVKKVVKEEVSNLHKNTIVPLAKKLIKVLEDSSLYGSTKWKNAAAFLSGLLAELKDEQAIKNISENLGLLIESEKLFGSVLIFFKSFPRLLTFLTSTDRQRFLAHLKTLIKPNIGVSSLEIIHSLFTEEALNEREQNDILNIFTENIRKSIKIISDSTDRTSVNELRSWVKSVEIMNILQIDTSFFDTLIKLIQDNDYYIVNDAIDLLNELEKNLLNRMDQKQISELFTAIINQAHGPGRGADKARALWEGMFVDYKEHFGEFVEYITKDYSGYVYFAEKTPYSERYIVDILDNLNEHNLIENVVNFIKERFNDTPIEIEQELYTLSLKLKKKNKSKWAETISEIENFPTFNNV